MKIYAYLSPLSTQREKNIQISAINAYCKRSNSNIHQWIGTEQTPKQDVKNINLVEQLAVLVADDLLICCEILDLGKNIRDVMDFLTILMQKQVRIRFVKDNMDIGSKESFEHLQYSFYIAGMIDKSLQSQRTKQGLNRAKDKGSILGRPKGLVNNARKLDGKEEEIQSYVNDNISYSAMARIMGVHRITMREFIIDKKIKPKLDSDDY